jgi:hypothetical protein
MGYMTLSKYISIPEECSGTGSPFGLVRVIVNDMVGTYNDLSVLKCH